MIEQSELRADDKEIVVPILREELDVQKQAKITGVVRLEKSIRTTETVIDELLLRESVAIEHVPVNRYIDEAVRPRQEGDTTIIPVMEEIVVVTKQLVLKEEIRITRQREQLRFQESVPLRVEQIDVTREDRRGTFPQSGNEKPNG